MIRVIGKQYQVPKQWTKVMQMEWVLTLLDFVWVGCVGLCLHSVVFRGQGFLPEIHCRWCFWDLDKCMWSHVLDSVSFSTLSGKHFSRGIWYSYLNYCFFNGIVAHYVPWLSAFLIFKKSLLYVIRTIMWHNTNFALLHPFTEFPFPVIIRE